MENEVRADRAGIVRKLSVEPAQAITTGQAICEIAAIE
jgi:biotin carboxyl carrier protein